MPHPFDGARAKIARAEEHYATLSREGAAFIASARTSCRTFGRHQKDGLEYAILVAGDIQVPLRLSVILGEAINQLRSTLDHLVYALVLANGGNPTNQHQFPICSTAQKYDEAMKRGRLSGISSRAARIIRNEQPFSISKPEDAVLFVLDEFSIQDKHRLLVVATAAAMLGEVVRVKASEPGTAIVGMGRPNQRVQVTAEGVEYHTVQLRAPSAGFSADADYVLELSVARRNVVVPVDKLLGLMIDGTKNMLELLQSEAG